MVFSFFKKSPEKMVAKPAAVPRAPVATPAAAEVESAQPVPEASARSAATAPAPENRELPSLDFTSPSEFSDFGDFDATSSDIHVEHDVDPVESDIEQVAILYANGQDAAVRTMLEDAIRVHRYGPGERLWLMLFDFYRQTGQKAPFEALGVDFAQAFEKSPPLWRDEQAPAAKPAASAGSIATFLFKGDLTGDNDAGFAALDQALDKNTKLRLDLAKVKDFDALGCQRLLGVLAKARKQKRELELLGREALATRFEARVETGKAQDDGCWLLLLEFYQLQGRQEAFDELAIDYAVTFEMSPPSWEPKRVAAPEPVACASVVPGDAMPEAYCLRGEVKAARFSDLPAFAAGQDPVILDFSAVTRIDFVSAGTLNNLLAPLKRQGKRVQIRHPNSLVAELLAVVGLKAVAGILPAKY